MLQLLVILACTRQGAKSKAPCGSKPAGVIRHVGDAVYPPRLAYMYIQPSQSGVGRWLEMDGLRSMAPA